MLLKKDLIDSMDSMYGDMFKTVSIPDFTKCIAQFAGMRVQDVKDEIIKEYLTIWAEHKYKFFKMLGNKTKLDMPITYQSMKDSISLDIEALKLEYPGFGPWLGQFEGFSTNKVDSLRNLGYYGRDWLRDYFPNYNIEGNTITGFFKRQLKAPDELVTALGRIFENDTITGTYTISIDPVDMMLASENPYNWQSCYRLETPNDASHADGCLAAILDSSSLITYIWDKEGKFNLYNHDLKSVRYKRIREWIAISPSMTAIHFNQIYPGKSSYPEDFRKQLRDMVETVVAKYLDKNNIWKKAEHIYCARDIYYGYGEFENDRIWQLKDADPESWDVYDTYITCPCGCGGNLPCSDNGDELIYNGDGFICESFYEEECQPYCSLGEDYCPYADDMCDSNCRGCWAYDNEYPLCNLDNETECENVDRDLVEDGRMRSCCGHCEGCPMWALHHPEEVTVSEEEVVEEAASSEPYAEFKSVLDEVHTLSVPLKQTITISNDNQIGFWTFHPRDNTTAYTISQEDMINMTFPELPTYVSYKEEVTLDQIRDAVEQASPQDILDIKPHELYDRKSFQLANEIIYGNYKK